MSAKVPRQSNLELLRILAMFGVLLVHADFGALGWPDSCELASYTFYSVIRTVVEAFSLVSVNVFILISGWFGINFRWEGLSKLLFQCVFFFFGIYFTLVFMGVEQFCLGGLWRCLMLGNNAWFVKCYIGLMIVAPIINAFVKSTDRRTFRNLLILFFVFQSIYGWISNGAMFIVEGYSVFSFCGLYMLARYIRIHSPRFASWSAATDFVIYVGLSLLTALMMIAAAYIGKDIIIRLLFKYTSPLLIAAAVFLLLGFSKKQFVSKSINAIAASCFAVYLLHFMIFPLYMSPTIRFIAQQNHYSILGAIEVFALLMTFFSSAVLIDRVRIVVWNKLISYLFIYDKDNR